jgi:hypothetical protein
MNRLLLPGTWPALARFAALLAAGIAVQVSVLHLMGQPPVCTCGVIRLWQGDVLGPENSQQLTDWYTPSHIIHGLLFSLGLKALFPRLSLLKAFAIALCLEIAWELAENSPPVIERYRQQALAQGYRGDSILNSVSDVLACTLGFFAARALPLKLALALIVAAELFTAGMIRDNLTLNIVQLLHPLPAIERWQAAGR